jgi:sterol 14-demethylase
MGLTSGSFLALFSGAPNIEHLYKGKGTLPEHLLTLFRRFLHKDRLAANLHDMVGDCLSSFQEIDAAEPMDPFDGIYLLIYRLTMRQFGTVDVANDPKLLRDTLRTFGALDDSSWLAIMFPRLPVPGRLRKIWAGAKLHRLFAGIIRERRRTGTRRDDAMQVMMDAGESDVIISAVSFYPQLTVFVC